MKIFDKERYEGDIIENCDIKFTAKNVVKKGVESMTCPKSKNELHKFGWIFVAHLNDYDIGCICCEKVFSIADVEEQARVGLIKDLCKKQLCCQDHGYCDDNCICVILEALKEKVESVTETSSITSRSAQSDRNQAGRLDQTTGGLDTPRKTQDGWSPPYEQGEIKGLEKSIEEHEKTEHEALWDGETLSISDCSYCKRLREEIAKYPKGEKLRGERK